VELAEAPLREPAETPVVTAEPMPRDSGYVFALGQISPRFPSLGVEKEFAQATGRTDTVGLTDRQAGQTVLSERANRYLARQLCWVLTIEGIETYILQPRDPADLDLLIDAFRPSPRRTDIDVVIGVRGPLAPLQLCNGLVLPIVGFSQLYSFDEDSLIAGIPRPDDVSEEQDEDFREAARGLLDRIMQLADNAGAMDEHRALNYLAVRYDRIYHNAAEQHRRDFALSAVQVRPSRLSTARAIFDVILTYRSRTSTDVPEQFFTRVDVTDEFPFLVTRLSPFFER
jgi:hypothetical protein